MATYDIRIGDVYQPFVGGVLSGVNNRVNAIGFDGGPHVQLSSDGYLRWLTCKHVATRMRLVERGGVRVGDVWRDGLDHYRVETLYGDTAQGTCGEGTFTFCISDIAAMRLVERDGKAV